MAGPIFPYLQAVAGELARELLQELPEELPQQVGAPPAAHVLLRLPGWAAWVVCVVLHASRPPPTHPLLVDGAGGGGPAGRRH